MIVYVGTGLLVSLLGQFTKGKYKKFAFFLLFVLLVLVFGLRGDFTSDYKNYYYLFNFYHNTSFTDIMRVESVQEVGFVLITKFLALFLSFHTYLIVIGCIIVGGFLYGFYQESSSPWVALILFLGFGSYFSSFNTMRQTMAAAVVFAGCKYLYSRNFKKFLFFVIIATTLHLSSILMLPMYFLLNLKISKTYIIRIIVLSAAAFFSVGLVVNLVRMFIPRFQTYSFGVYGMTGGTIGYFVSPVVMSLLFGMLCFIGPERHLCIYDKKENIQLNALGYAFIISVLTTQAFLIYRFSEFLLPHTFLLISNRLAKVRLQANKKIITIGIVLLSLAYIFISLSRTGYDPYYFYWQS